MGDVVLAQTVPVPEGVEVTATGLTFTRKLSYKEWAEYGVMLQAVEGAIQWWIGDWIRYGEQVYGETYAQAVEETGLTQGTLQNIVYVSGAIPASRRREDVSFGHHQTVAPLDDAEQDAFLSRAAESGWTIRETREAVRVYKHEIRSNDPGPLPVGAYQTIVADPPWRFGDDQRGNATHHYETMSTDEICDLPVPQLAGPTSHLYLWVPNGHLDHGFRVIDAWLFDYKTVLTWKKPSIGTGHYFRNDTEQCLFAARQNHPTKAEANSIGTGFEAPRTGHSSKPDEFYEIVEAASSGPFVELFARRHRQNWDQWGDGMEERKAG